MSNKKTVGCAFSIIRIPVIMSIWFYLLYQILVRVEATELMFFLFWVYVPMSLVLTIGSAIIEVYVKD